MRAIRSKDTVPEMVVRRLAHALGYRFRLHRPDLPGKPDIVFPGRRKVVFVHGCFWHGHDCRRGDVHPKTNPDYWRTKIERNKARDAVNLSALEDAGWQVITVWECETKPVGRAKLSGRLKTYLR
jgi:DNA mismatch endonuclease (patch repair protein)